MPFYKTLRWKMSVINIGIILFIVTTIGMFSYYETSRTIEKDVERFSSLILKQANLNLDRYFQEYTQGLMQIGSSNEFQNWLRLGTDELFDQYSLWRQMKDNYFLPLSFRRQEIMSISMRSIRGNESHYTFQYGLDKEYKMDTGQLSDIDGFNRFYVSVSVSDDYLSNKGERLSVPVISIIKRFGMILSGYIKIDISLEPAQNILAEMKLGKSVIGLIADESGTILVHPDESMILSKLSPDIVESLNDHASGSFMRDGTKEMVVYETNEQTGWKTIAIIPYDDFAGSIYSVRDMTIVTALVGAVIAMTLIIWVTTSMTKRITKLRQIIKQTGIGNFQFRIKVDGDDELSDLSQAYNRMLGELEDSIQRSTESKLLEQRAIISALQSQIHSHFLYNTLESINSMAHLAHHQEIELVTVALSRMLRYTSNYQESMVTVQDEVQHLSDYLQICRIRFGDEFTYDIHVEGDCRTVPCLKALLQPIAENAIKHGLEETGEPLHIDVRVRVLPEEESMEIAVTDNGRGFAPEKIDALNAQLAAQVQGRKYNELSRVGLLNVNYRLKMHYSDGQAGIRLGNMPEPLQGAVVTIRFPKASDDF